MDIRDWPFDQIMQLPDHCFGSRFQVAVVCQGADGAAAWDISELALPEKCVIWEWHMCVNAITTDIARARLALGDILPTTTAIMDGLEPVFRGFGVQGPEPRDIIIARWGLPAMRVLKQPLLAAGRRFILEVTGEATKTPIVCFVFSISSMPTEVPDCLLSANLRSQL